VDRAHANALDNFELSMKPKVEELMIDRMEQNQEIVTRYFNDGAFGATLFKALVRRVYDEIRSTRGSQPPASS
jgi:type I restriction enzyme R subunit